MNNKEQKVDTSTEAAIVGNTLVGRSYFGNENENI